jgi:hypothetical protein
MTTISEVEILLDELTISSPPPPLPLGVSDEHSIRRGSGKWVVVPVGVGIYAIRVEYDLDDGKKLQVKVPDEVRGAPQAISMAVRFSLQLANSHRFYWQVA